MWIRRDGSVQGPLWPREIREIVTAKFMKVTCLSSACILHKLCIHLDLLNFRVVFSIVISRVLVARSLTESTISIINNATYINLNLFDH